MCINLNKCQLNKGEVKYLGYYINANGVRPDPNKIEAIDKISSPRTFKQLGSFLGMINYYTRFIPKLTSHMTTPLETF